MNTPRRRTINTETGTLPTQSYDGQVLDARLHLLDRQVLDNAETPVMVVDDIELTDITYDDPIPTGTAAPTITNLLSGPILGTRIFGGKPPSSRLHRVAWKHISTIDTTIRLGINAAELDVTWTERWVRDRIIGRIPGGHHDPE